MIIKRTIHFTLQKQKNASSRVRMRVSYNGKRIDFQTGIVINESNWNQTKQRVSGLDSNSSIASDFNDHLSAMLTKMIEVFRQFELMQHVPTASELRDAFTSPSQKVVVSETSEDPHNANLSAHKEKQNSNKKKALGKEITQNMAWADSVINTNDILYFYGDKAGMQRLALDYHLEDMHGTDLDFYDIGIAELVLLPTSSLIGTRIKNSRLREDHSVSVLGIRHGEEYLTDALGNHRLKNGDILLVQGQWDNIIQMNQENEDWVVLGRPDKKADKVLLDYKAPVAAAIMVLMVLMMVFHFIPVAPVTAVLIAALLVVLTGCFRSVDAAYKTINWESVILIAAMMPMSTALEKTGASQIVSESLVSSLGSLGPYALLAGLYFATSLTTMFISNTATAVLMAPIALVAAQQTNLSPYPFILAVTLGASMCFASPFSTSPNALVMKAGHYTFMDYIRVGLPLQIIIGIVMVFVLPLLFPF